MDAFLLRNVTPRFISRFTGLWNRACPPDLFTGHGIVRGDHTRIGTAFRLAAAAGNDLAVGDDRARCLLRALLIVEDLRFPGQRAGLCIEREDEVVGTGVDDLVTVDREIAIDGEDRHERAEVRGQPALVLPSIAISRSTVTRSST